MRSCAPRRPTPLAHRAMLHGYRDRVDLRLLRYFVAVAEERHFGRAAQRLNMTQPPLSRGIQQLEHNLDARLVNRSSRAVSLTPAGHALYPRACALLEQAEQLRTLVADACGTRKLTVGTLVDTAEQIADSLVPAFRRRHPDVDVHIHEYDLADPTAGLRAGLVDVALTRAPFLSDGISTHVLRSDPVGVLLRANDPLAHHAQLSRHDLDGRHWFRLPDEADPLWRNYWNGSVQADQLSDSPVVRTVQECLQAAMWTGRIGLAPLSQPLPTGLVIVPLVDMPPSDLIVAWHSTNADPLALSFCDIAAKTH